MIEDERLKYLADMMSEVLAIQSMCKVLKKEGYLYEDIDKHLVFFYEVSQAIVVAMNDRLKELMEHE